MHEGQVLPPYRPSGQGTTQSPVGIRMQGNSHHPGSVLVEAVDNTPAWVVPYTFYLRPAVEDRRHQRAAAVPGARMGHHPGRLVHDCQVGILKQDVERNGFGSDHSRTVRNEPDPVPGCNPGPR